MGRRTSEIKRDADAATARKVSSDKAAADAAAAKAKIASNLASKQQEIDNSDQSVVSNRIAKNFGANQSARQRDLVSGSQFGEAVLGEKGLGRLSTDTDVQDTLSRFKDISENGLSSKEVEAERTQLFSGIDRNVQTSLRGLQGRLAASGVRGASAGRAVTNAALEGASQKTDVERQLFLKSAQTKRQGLQDFSSKLGAVKSFDLAQESREKDIVLQAGLGQAQLGVSERSAKAAADAQRQSAQASSGGGGK